MIGRMEAAHRAGGGDRDRSTAGDIKVDVLNVDMVSVGVRGRW